jgi:signal transduction histidine kinase
MTTLAERDVRPTAVSDEPAQARSPDRLLRGVAVGVAASALVLVAAALVLHASYVRRGFDVPAPHAGDLVLGTLFPLAGALVLWRQPRNAAGWVLLSAALVAVSTLAHEWAYDGAVADPGSLPLVPVAIWLASWTYVPYWVQPTLLPVLFPDGRLPSARWRGYVRAVAALLALLTFVAMFKPDDDVEGLGLTNPLALDVGIPITVWGPVQFGTVMVLWCLFTPVALVGMIRRMRRATGRERAQLQWLLLGIVVGPALSLLSLAVPVVDGELVLAVGFACIPLGLAVAVLRHQMLDVEVVVNRTIVYGLLTAASLVAYVSVVAVAARYVGTDGAGPVVAAVIVVLAASARTRVQRVVDRRLFGARRDPYAVVQRVGASTAAAAAPHEALDALVVTVAETLRLPFVQVLDAAGDPVAQAGEPVVGTHVLSVVDRGRDLGVLVVGRRSRKERLRPQEESALREVAHRAGALLSARQLTADLQRSYERAVRAREEERRRLRRELHDGVGPALAGMALQLDSLAARLPDADLTTRAERLRDRLQTTVVEVRRIVDGLRPGAVDELGLADALRTLGTEADAPVHVGVDVELPATLPAGVESAVYRIASEAVTNVVRHAAATRADVRARLVDGAVVLSIDDDGCGFGADVTTGVGLRSMHDRAAETGGALEVDSDPGRGTQVTAVIPVQRR